MQTHIYFHWAYGLGLLGSVPNLSGRKLKLLLGSMPSAAAAAAAAVAATSAAFATGKPWRRASRQAVQAINQSHFVFTQLSRKHREGFFRQVRGYLVLTENLPGEFARRTCTENLHREASGKKMQRSLRRDLAQRMCKKMEKLHAAGCYPRREVVYFSCLPTNVWNIKHANVKTLLLPTKYKHSCSRKKQL